MQLLGPVMKKRGSFTLSPIRLLDNDLLHLFVAGTTNSFGVGFRMNTAGFSGTLSFGNSNPPFLYDETITDHPQWHEDEPNTTNPEAALYEVAILELLEEPGDLPLEWPAANGDPVIGEYHDMGSVRHLILPSSAGDPVGFLRTFECVMSIRRISDLELLAQANIRFTVQRT